VSARAAASSAGSSARKRTVATQGRLVLLLVIAYLLGLLSATAGAERLIPLDELDKLGGAAIAALHGESGSE
jgi:hypothetical protein